MATTRLAFLATAAGCLVQAARKADSTQAVEESIFAATNRERRARGLPALVWSETLAEEARRHSEQMERRRFFGHTDPRRGDLAQRLKRAGIEHVACAENIYAQSQADGVALAAMKAWMRSRGHRANLLNGAYREAAVGVATGRGGHCSVTQIFLVAT